MNHASSYLGQFTPHADASVGHFTGQDEEQVVWRQTQDARLGQLGDGGDDSWGGRGTAKVLTTMYTSQIFPRLFTLVTWSISRPINMF